MNYFYAFIVSVLCALINLPLAMDGKTYSIFAMAFCSAMALWNLVMGAIEALKRR